MAFPFPEMTTFGNATGQDIPEDGSVAVRERRAGKRAWRPSRGMGGITRMVQAGFFCAGFFCRRFVKKFYREFFRAVWFDWAWEISF